MKEDDDNESMHVDCTTVSLTSQGRRSRESSFQCKICGAPAEHSNYGVISCSPCKMFFRRNATTGQEKFVCDFDGLCEINVNNRHICSSCRLAKCFTNGMQPDMIRCSLSKRITAKQRQNNESESITTTLNILTGIEEHNQLHTFPTLNLLKADNSTLYSAQWALLSNLIYSYDESKLFSIAEQIINSDNTEHSITSTNSELARKFFVEVYETTEKYLRSNGDLYTLGPDDRTIFLPSAAESVTWLGAIFCWNHFQLYNCQSFMANFKNIYGDTCMNLIQNVLKFIESDTVIFKLALSIFTFCNNISLLRSITTSKTLDTLALFRIQNIYAEVTWKYLLYKYNFTQCVQRFMKIVQCFLAVTDTIYNAQNILLHVKDIETTIEKTELTLVLDDIERIDANEN
ncbi:unnamed protein product [Adineta steineri]|uniref:Nuclear receptor domain-containing protein n=1 Tax=Adineta steineri TaxID=433720 RepID=A0A818T723_9BILA|nr:unnamed protein product [Adineta steineri]CAF1189644.1 unnamed protein product [Adineta steineri]CAF3493174.1 unnamed protein product [Adineta steineri]CAF3673310.1 unnamed protein product [Adineta steineri]